MKKTVKDFKDYDFDNCDVDPKYWGDYTSANFYRKGFIPIVRSEMKKIAKNLGAELFFNPMHFEWSAFFKKGYKCVYVSTSDHRSWKWYDDVLFRTANDEHDYTGGCNRRCSYDQIEQSVRDLLED